MKATPLKLRDVLLLEPQIFGDERGFFYESFNQHLFESIAGRPVTFVQDNHSRSRRNVLRGLHYQIRQTQAKLVRVIAGEVFDVVVDLRKRSSTFGGWTSTVLSADNRRQVWIPEGFAHGFLVLSDIAEVLYKATDYWAPQHERCIAWNDPELAIDWPLREDPVLSDRDRQAPRLDRAEVFEQPRPPSGT
jgi:dTDP-4-dehydrorhamnose 3,5-epimerase